MSTKSTSETDEPGRIEQKIAELEHPHRDAEILREMYVEKERSSYQIADEVGCSSRSVLRALHRHEIPVREPRRVERASYVIDSKGYERWRAREPDGSIVNVAVHQLTAIAEGADPEKVFSNGEHQCHHRCPVSWLNIPGLVEVLTPSEHRRTHDADGWTVDEETGLPVLVTQDS